MTIKMTQYDEKLLLALEGILDTTTAPQLQDALIPAFDETKSIELNFSGVDYVSSAGLRVLLLGQKTAIAKNAFMSIGGVSEDIMEIFEMTGFTDMLTIV